ncbi:hypothetical protein ACU639_31175 [Streptomyces cynarae]|uniref:hypothetical protein n=1 Tax=Streptomyces cynarae TaxID=2981134 RepID=UPI00406C148A
MTTGLLDATGVDEATLYFRAFCDGLAGLELDALIPVGTGEHLWRTGLDTLVRGLTKP